MKIGVALAGGGVRGAAHVGAMKALIENGIKIDAIGGTSVGGIVAALYAMGYDIDEIKDLFKVFSKTVMGNGPKDLFANLWEMRGAKFQGLTSSKNIEAIVKQMGLNRNVAKISDVKMPICIPATDLISDNEIIFTNNIETTGERYIKDIEIGKAVRASASFPFVYAPFDYGKYQFVDGGVCNGLPAEEVKKLGVDKVISIKFDLKTETKQKTIYNITMQSVDLMTENLLKDAIQASDVVLDIKLRDVKVFNMKKLDFCYQEGYEQTLYKIPEIKKKLGLL